MVSAEVVPPTPQRWAGPDLRRRRLAHQGVEEVLPVPDDAPRVELSDGAMLVVPSPTLGQQEIGDLPWMWFRGRAPRAAGQPTAGAAGQPVAGAAGQPALERPFGSRLPIRDIAP